MRQPTVKAADIARTAAGDILRDARPLLPADWDLSTEELLPVLTRVWGFSSFRPGQEAAMRRVLAQQSTLVVQSTGSGKSLCFQLPAALVCARYRAMVVVVSPLLSLVQDQIRSLPAGLCGASLNSSQGSDLVAKTKAAVMGGEVDLLYLSPETLATDWCRRLLQHPQTPPVAFACVDEAHCVSEWSHNFRPAYLRLRRTLTTAMGVRCLLALTATATRVAEASVCHHLGIAPAEGVVRTFQMPSNLHLSVSQPEHKLERLVHLLRTHHQLSHGAAIVYCGRQAETEQVAAYLRTCDVQARAFHAGMQSKAKQAVQNAFKRGDLRAVVATIAFGMGLDMHAVRCVVHYSFPKSPENYVQEVGRAGRDGAPAYGHLFVDDDDLFTHRCHVHADAVDRNVVQRFLRHMLGQLRAADADEGDLACRLALAIAGTGGAGEGLLSAASAGRQGQTGGGVVVLNVEALAEELDVRPSVLETFVSSLEQQSDAHLANGGTAWAVAGGGGQGGGDGGAEECEGEGAGAGSAAAATTAPSATERPPLAVEQLPPAPCEVIVIVKDATFAATDPVLAAVLEAASSVAFDEGGGGGRQGNGGYRRRAVAAATRRLDATALAAVANVTGLTPNEVVRALFGMARGGVLSLEERGRALCLRLSRMPAPEDVDRLCSALFASVGALEHLQLAKLDALRSMMHTALAQEPASEDDTRSAAMDRFLKRALNAYFEADTPAALGLGGSEGRSTAVDIDAPEHVPVRQNLRSFIETHDGACARVRAEERERRPRTRAKAKEDGA